MFTIGILALSQRVPKALTIRLSNSPNGTELFRKISFTSNMDK